MNNKVNQRLLAFGSLIVVFFVSGSLRDAATKFVNNRLDDRYLDQTPQDDWAKWNNSVSDLCERQKIYQIEKKHSKHKKLHRPKKHFKDQEFEQLQQHYNGLVKIKVERKDQYTFLDKKRLYNKHGYIDD